MLESFQAVLSDLVLYHGNLQTMEEEEQDIPCILSTFNAFYNLWHTLFIKHNIVENINIFFFRAAKAYKAILYHTALQKN